MNLKKLILTGAVFLSSINLFSQNQDYLIQDLNSDGKLDSLFWKRSEIYASKGYFPSNYVDYALFISYNKDQPPEELYKFSYRIRNEKIPESPKLIFHTINPWLKKVEFWKSHRTKKENWSSCTYHDQYKLIEINFLKPTLKDNTENTIKTVVDTGLQKYISPSEYFH